MRGRRRDVSRPFSASWPQHYLCWNLRSPAHLETKLLNISRCLTDPIVGYLFNRASAAEGTRVNFVDVSRGSLSSSGCRMKNAMEKNSGISKIALVSLLLLSVAASPRHDQAFVA